MNIFLQQLKRISESRRSLIVVFLFAALLMGSLNLVRLGSDLNFDGEIYISSAAKYAAGLYREGLQAYPMPIYPFLISLAYKIIGNWVISGRLISYFSVILTVIPIYLISKNLFNSRSAFLAGLSFSLMPSALLHSTTVMRDPPFCLCFVWSVYFAQKVTESKKFFHLICLAMFAWISTLFRIEGGIIFPVFFAFICVLIIFQKKDRTTYRRVAVCWVFIVMIILGPIIIGMMQSRTDILNRYYEWINFYNGFNNQKFFENYLRISEQLQLMNDANFYGDVGEHFAGFAKHYLLVIYLIGFLGMLTDVVLPVNIFLIIYGCYFCSYDSRHVLLLIMTGATLLMAYVFLIVHDLLIHRYLFTAAALLCPWIGFGLNNLIKSIEKHSLKTIGAICFILLVIIMPALKFDKYFLNRDDLKTRAGIWIANNEYLKNIKIIFSDPGVKFHAGIPSSFSNDGNYILHQKPEDRDFSKIAIAAIENKAEAIVIYSPENRRDKIANFIGYKEIKEISDKRKFVKIFLAISDDEFITSPPK
jgi:4-amino-4-deoxy-L-arabinose transferase-like glycosyltransferase